LAVDCWQLAVRCLYCQLRTANRQLHDTIPIHPPPGRARQRQRDAGQDSRLDPRLLSQCRGDIFRSLDLQSEIGRVFWDYAGKGKLVPDEITIRVWKQFIKGMEMINQFHAESEILVLDGIPRNVQQAKLLADTLDVQKVIHLDCADMNKMVERLRRRALRENRFDDASDEVIRRRLAVYERETMPLLDFYPQEQVVRIEATMSQIRVLSDLVKVLVPLKEDMDKQREARTRETEAAKAG